MALIIPGVNVDATFANGDIINGVAHFVTDTKPTQRIPTTDNPTPPLVTGDRWYKSDDGTEWFWNGTYWLESKLRTTGGMANPVTGVTSSGVNLPAPGTTTINNYPVNRSVFLERARYTYKVLTTNDGSNYWTFAHRIWGPDGVQLVVGGTIDTASDSPGINYQASETLNQFLNKTSNHCFIGGLVTKTGSPGALVFFSSIEYRIVAE